MIKLNFKKLVIFCMLIFGVGLAAIWVIPDSAKAQADTKGLTSEHKKYVEGEVIVKFKASLSSAKSLSLSKENNLSLKAVIPEANANVQLLKINSNENVNSVIRSLLDSGLVELAQPNYLYYADSTASNDVKFPELWGLNNTGQNIQGVIGTENIDLDAPEAWEYTNGLNDVIVAVLDTGIDINHPDLIGKTVQGWDFFHGDSTVYDEEDGDFHGTHVAGTIAAAANTIGIRGVAANVKIMPLKFIGPTGGDSLGAIAAIQFAKEHGAQVINASWGGEGGVDDELLNKAIEDSGIVFVASAGNEGSNNDIIHKSPTNLSAPNIISVAAINNKGQLAAFSNYGLNSVDVGAPGVDILSTFPKFGQADYSEAYNYLSGTSMAAPYVSGIAGVLLGQKHLTSAETISLIKQSGVTLASLQGRTSSGKMVNLNNAVASQVSKPTIILSSSKAGEKSDYLINFQLSSFGKLVKGDRITLTFPMAAWPFPNPNQGSSPSSSSSPPPVSPVTPNAAPTIEYSLKINGITSLAIPGGNPPSSGGGSSETAGFSLIIEVPVDTPSGSIVGIGIPNLINPGAGTYAVSVSTSVDPKPINSDFYTITTNGLPAVPISNFAITGTTSTTASFSWGAAEKASSVAILKSTDGKDWSLATTLAPITINGSSAKVIGLTESTFYMFKLIVIGGVNSGDSNTVYGITSEQLKPTAAIALSSTTLELYFNEPVELLTSENILNYSIDHNVSVIKAVRQTDAERVILTTSLINGGAVYKATINHVTDLDGNIINPLQNTINFAGTNNQPPGPITSFMSAEKTATTASFNWVAPFSATSISIQKSTDGTNWSAATTSAPISPNGDSVAAVTGLTANTAYQFKLVVVGGANAGESNIVSLTTLLTDPFSLIGAVALSNTMVELTFNKPLDLITSQLIENYSIAELYGAETPISVFSAVRQIDPMKVILTTSSQNPRTVYTVAVENVKDTGGATLEPYNNYVNFAGVGFLANPTIKSARVEAEKIALEYSQFLDPASIPAPSDFEILINQSISSVKVKAVFINELYVTLILESEILENQIVSLNYHHGVNPIKDLEGHNAADLNNLPVANVLGAPELVRADALTNAAVILTFNKPLDKQSAESLDKNYTIDNSLVVLKAELQQDPTKVVLTTSHQTAGILYKVKALLVRDTSGKLIRLDKSEANFVGASEVTVFPAAPIGLIATGGDGFVTLSWNANTESNLAGYNVYVDGGKHNSALIAGTNYTVRTLNNGQPYRFKISSIDSFEHESLKSDEVTAIPNAPIKVEPQPQGPQTGGPQPGSPQPSGLVNPDNTPPAKPTGLNARAGDSEVVLQWTANGEPDLSGYNIYQNGSKLNKATVTGSTYTIKPLTNGTAYAFQISAVDSSGNESARSIEATATPQLVFKDNPAGGLNYQLLGLPTVDSAVFIKAFELLENKKSHILTLLLPEAEAGTSVKLLIKDLYLLANKQPDAVIEIKSVNKSFLLPVKLMDFAALETKLGTAAFNNVWLAVSMEKADQASQDAFILALGEKDILISPIINFSIALESNGKQELLTDFNRKYVSKTIELDEQSNPNELTAVTLDEATGQLAFVPAIFQNIRGKTEVTFKSPHNSLYGVVRTVSKFTDLSNHWAKKDIELLAGKGLVKGVSEEKFNPNASVTRAEFTLMVSRALGLKDDKQAAAGLSDISQDKWYAGAVGAAVKAGVINGYKNGTFAPNEQITREQMAVMIGNALQFLEASVNIRDRQDLLLSALTDQQAISVWAIPSVAELLDTDIINGRADHSYAPQAYTSRAEAAVMLVRFLQFIQFINK